LLSLLLCVKKRVDELGTTKQKKRPFGSRHQILLQITLSCLIRKGLVHDTRVNGPEFLDTPVTETFHLFRISHPTNRFRQFFLKELRIKTHPYQNLFR
jgi:hypothetical protein